MDLAAPVGNHSTENINQLLLFKAWLWSSSDFEFEPLIEAKRDCLHRYRASEKATSKLCIST